MGGSSTTSSSAEPWDPIQPHVLGLADQAQALYDQGGFAPDPYKGQRVAGFGGVSNEAQSMMVNRARGGTPLLDQASSGLSGMMQGGANPALEAVKQNALGSAIPAAVSMFSGSGMANSSQAMDTVGRAATEAVAPYEYGAWNDAQNRALSAYGMAPQMEQAGYLPSQMLGQVGAAQDFMHQQSLDAEMAKYYEGQNQQANNLRGYSDIISPIATMGGSSQSTTTQSPGIGEIIGTGLQAIGMLGMSDRRLKENIRKIGEWLGHNLYSYNYLWSPTVEVGVMADEVPHAIAGTVGGFSVVDYGRV